MNGRGWLKLAGLISAIVLLDIMLLSPGFVGLSIGRGDPLEAATAVTALVMSFVVLIYGCRALLFPSAMKPPDARTYSREDFLKLFGSFRGLKAYRKEADAAMEQLRRLDKKKSALHEVLGRRFEPSELSHRKFTGAIEEVEGLFYLHLRSMLHKMSAVHAAEIASPDAASPHRSPQLIQAKTTLYQQYVVYVTGCLSANEGILLKLDQLLLEITKLNLADHLDVMEMPCMKEIDALINQTKRYKP
ncbi:hypothetical protein [Paenibacillus sp. PL2-23]|uniref:hypothetical protein n=1 Tax=Paenibacillus sp. PL2-23 TaxID=2100729 RepID=UPI0030FB30BA